MVRFHPASLDANNVSSQKEQVVGYYYPIHVTSRKELVDYLVRPFKDSKYKILRHCLRGNVLWQVREDPAGKYIHCDLLVKAGDGRWGYKPMGEACHPYYYTCPLSYLKMTRNAVQCREWRNMVEAYHIKRRKK